MSIIDAIEAEVDRRSDDRLVDVLLGLLDKLDNPSKNFCRKHDILLRQYTETAIWSTKAQRWARLRSDDLFRPRPPRHFTLAGEYARWNDQAWPYEDWANFELATDRSRYHQASCTCFAEQQPIENQFLPTVCPFQNIAPKRI